MTATTFDTLAYAKKLKAVGVLPAEAEVHAEALFELVDEKLATKTDLKILGYKLIIWLGSMIVASTIATISILGFLMNGGH